MKRHNEIQAYLERARLNETGRHWVDNFIAPTMLVHLFLRAEREGDFNLRNYALYHMLRVFFVAGHVSYGHYMLQYLEGLKDLPKKAIEDLKTGAFVCRHKAGHFNGKSGDQFGEQTAVKEEKSKLKGISLEPEQVAEFVDSLPIIAQVVLSMDEMYGSLLDDGDEKIIKHKEEMPARKHLDKKDRELVLAEIMKYDHPLEDTRPYLVNPVTGKRASPDVSVQNSKEIGDKMVQDFRESLPDGFCNKISSKIVTMASKSTPKTATKSTVLPLELMCPNLLTVGQQRNVSLKQMLSHELCAQPPNIIDKFGHLRKSAKAPIVKKLGVVCIAVDQLDAVMVDVSQLFYHTLWPCGGSITDLLGSITEHAAQYPKEAEKILVLDKHNEKSSKEQERLRRGKEESNEEYDLNIK